MTVWGDNCLATLISLPTAVQDSARRALSEDRHSAVFSSDCACSEPGVSPSLTLSHCCRLVPCSVVHIKLCLLSQHLFSLIKRQRSDQLCPILFIELNFAKEKLQAGLGKASPSSCCASAINGCGSDRMQWRGWLLYRIQITAWYAKLTMICPRCQFRCSETDGRATQTAEYSSFSSAHLMQHLEWNHCS